jgi:hypothetical protein
VNSVCKSNNHKPLVLVRPWFPFPLTRLCEPVVVREGPITNAGLQVIQRHGVTIPCPRFYLSENSHKHAVLGRLGQHLGHFGHDSRSHDLFQCATS